MSQTLIQSSRITFGALPFMTLPPTMCHVYVDYRPDGKPFYVGLGRTQRVSKKGRSRAHKAICDKSSGWYRKIVETNTRELCIELEQFLISEIGRRDLGNGPLVNHTDGGEGVIGLKHKESTKKELSIKATLQFQDPNQIEVQRQIHTALWEDPEYRRVNSQANAERAKKQETRDKISRSGKGRVHSESEKNKRAQSLKNIHAIDQNLKEKMVNVGKEIASRPEVASKMKDAAIRYKTSDKGRKETSDHFSGTIWITNGTINKRIREYDLSKHDGFIKGRVFKR